MLFWANTIDEKYKKIHQMPINVQHLMYKYAAIRNVQAHSFFTLRISMNALIPPFAPPYGILAIAHFRDIHTDSAFTSFSLQAG